MILIYLKMVLMLLRVVCQEKKFSEKRFSNHTESIDCKTQNGKLSGICVKVEIEVRLN